MSNDIPVQFYLVKTHVPSEPEPRGSWLERAKNGVTTGLWMLLGVALVPLMLAALAVFGGGALLVDAYQRGRRRLGLGETLPAEPAPEPPQELLRHEQVVLATQAPDWDAEVGPEVHRWLEPQLDYYADYFGGDIARLHTTPEIPGLHGQLVGGLCAQWAEGVLLQLFRVRPGQEPVATSWLVYLELATLAWHRVAEVGDVYLLADDKQEGLLTGVSMHGATVRFEVKPLPPLGPVTSQPHP